MWEMGWAGRYVAQGKTLGLMKQQQKGWLNNNGQVNLVPLSWRMTQPCQ